MLSIVAPPDRHGAPWCDFLRATAQTPTLSVYLQRAQEARSRLAGWPQDLARAVESARVGCESDADRAQFDACVDVLQFALATSAHTSRSRDWFGAFTASGASIESTALRPVTTSVVWHTGAVLLPYVAARIAPPLWLLLVSASVIRIAQLTARGIDEVETYALPEHVSADARVASSESDVLETWQMLVVSATRRIIGLMNGNGLLLIGGTDEHTRCIMEQLPASKAERAACSETLRVDATTESQRAEALALAAPLLAAHQRRWIDQLASPAHSERDMVHHWPAVKAAIRDGTAEHVAFTPTFAATWPTVAEAVCRAVLQAGDVIEVVEPLASWQLDALAGGIIAQRRTPCPVTPRRVAAARLRLRP